MDEDELDNLIEAQELLTTVSEQLSEIIQSKKIADKLDRLIRELNDLIDQETTDEDSW